MIARLLLPRAEAWRTAVGTSIRGFFASFDSLTADVKTFSDLVYLDLIPEYTRELDQWDEQFGLAPIDLADSERRARLRSAWAAVGGQSPRYIQDTLQAAGFNVYVHEWWDPTTLAVRNPLLHLRQTYPGTVPGVDCGEALAECGEAFAECGNTVDPTGYALVNANPPDAYVVPNDADYWPYFMYLCGETFGEPAYIDPIRRNEFEALCLKICPAHLWVGLIVEY